MALHIFFFTFISGNFLQIVRPINGINTIMFHRYHKIQNNIYILHTENNTQTIAVKLVYIRYQDDRLT